MKMWIFCAFLHTSYALQLRVKNSVTTRWQQTFRYADPTQSRSCQRAGIVNNEKIKFLIQNRPTTVAKNRRRSWKSGTQLSQAETDFFSFSSPFNNLGADMPAWLSDFVIFFSFLHFLFIAVCLVENTSHGGSAWSAGPCICHLRPADDVCSFHTFFMMYIGSKMGFQLPEELNFIRLVLWHNMHISHSVICSVFKLAEIPKPLNM